MWVHLRSRDITVSRNSLARCNGRHLRIRHLVQFILAGPVYHNALTNCATRVCCACAGPVSGTANMSRHGSTLCSPTVEKILCRSLFAAVTCRQSAPDYPRERGDPQEGGNRRCLPSCAPARRQRNFPRFASDTPAALHQNAKEEHCCLAVSLFAHITGFCFPDFSAVPHGGALLRSPEALSPALQRTRVSPGRCAYARDSRSYPRTDRAFSADD